MRWECRAAAAPSRPEPRILAITPRPGSQRGPARGRVVGLLTHATVSNDIEGIVMEATTNVAAATCNLFRYDGGEYIYYNWSTKARTQGTYSNARRPR